MWHAWHKMVRDKPIIHETLWLKFALNSIIKSSQDYKQRLLDSTKEFIFIFFLLRSNLAFFNRNKPDSKRLIVSMCFYNPVHSFFILLLIYYFFFSRHFIFVFHWLTLTSAFHIGRQQRKSFSQHLSGGKTCNADTLYVE